jgi:hypothetical protein
MERFIGKLPSISTTSKTIENPRKLIAFKAPSLKMGETILASLGPLGVN